MKAIRPNRIVYILAFLCVMSASIFAAETITKQQIEKTFADFARFEYGGSPLATHAVNEVVQLVGDKPDLRLFAEKQMIALLESDATYAAKDYVCRKLWTVGSDASVDVLAEMLRDEKTAEIACFALRTNPSKAVDAALCEALSDVSDSTKIRIVNILGDRRSANCVKTLAGYLNSQNDEIARGAALSLGTIATPAAHEAVSKARARARGDKRAYLTRALLRCAQSCARDGNAAQAVGLCWLLFDKSESLLTRRSALTTAMNTGDAKAEVLMAEALKDNNTQLQATAIANSRLLEGPEVTKRLAAALKVAESPTQVLIIEALADRSDSKAANTILASATSDNEDVRIACYNALTDMGDPRSTQKLLQGLASNSGETETTEILACLRRTTVEAADVAIITSLQKTPSHKSQLIDVLRDRSYTSAIAVISEYMTDKDSDTAKSAFRAVGAMGDANILNRVIDALAKTDDLALQNEAIAAVMRIAERSDDVYQVAQIVISRFDKTPSQSLLKALAAAPCKESLDRINASLKVTALRETAIRTLAEYPDVAAADLLLDVLANSDDSTQRILALRGCVRIIKTQQGSADLAVSIYSKAAKTAKSAAEKKLVLSGLSATVHPQALQLAKAYLNDPDVKDEAALAVKTIRDALTAAGIPQDAVSIFDGRTFTGWEGNLDMFRIKDGAIVGGMLDKSIPRNEFLCAKTEYANFELNLQVKLLGDPASANAGIQIRSRRIPNHHEMIGYQADMGQHYWGSLYDESRRRKVLAAADRAQLDKVLKLGDWNHYRIRCQGRRIQLWINGYKTVDYTEPDDSIEQTGLIGLQIHSGKPSESWYKDITIKKL